MKTPDQRFDDMCAKYHVRRFAPAVSEYGKLFQYQRKLFEARVERSRNTLLANSPIDFCFDFIDRGIINAWAKMSDDVALIALCKGTIYLPLEAFCRMFSDPGVHPGIGEAGLESRGPQHSDPLPLNFDELVAIREKQGRNTMPQPPKGATRCQYVRVCIQVVCDFFVIHEISHAVHGHFGLLESWSISSPMTGGNLPPIDYQAVEMLADLEAACGSLDAFLGRKIVGPAQWNLAEPRIRLYFWVFALTTAFLLLDMFIDPDDLSNERHPPEPMRFSSIIVAAQAYLDNKHPELAKEFGLISRDAQLDVSLAMGRINGPMMDNSSLADFNDSRVQKHRTDLINHMGTVLSELPTYAYIDMPEVDFSSDTPNPTP